jgi:predicted nucleotidyltransferase component of viral defense system
MAQEHQTDQSYIRRLILTALFRDSWFLDRLSLKGGNAMNLVYGVGMRTSLDLDFSIQDDFKDLEETGSRIRENLEKVFQPEGLTVFDFTFMPKPKQTQDDWWGGYRAEFKLIDTAVAEVVEYKLETMRRRSLCMDPISQKRKYTIEISKFEYIEQSSIVDYEGTDIRIYSPILLAAEKLRALIQQHPEYPQISQETKRSRGRDFYDIWALCDHFTIMLSAHLETIERVFEAKKVPLHLLSRLEDLKALHEASWADVELAVSGRIEPFDYYFDYVNSAAQSLYSQWVVDHPG